MQRIRRIAAFAAGSLAAATLWAASPYISKVYEYSPAPGQFVNEMPLYEPGDDAAAMAAKAGEQLVGDRTPGMISLGSYGGYVVFGFDHPLVNVHGRYDFQVYGNAFPAPSSSAEPGVVSVSVDANGNGLPDDPWYELAGSDQKLPTTLHGSRVVYYRPADGHTAKPDPDNKAVTDMEYVAYQLFDSADSEGVEGWIHQVSFHTQSYWPAWLGDKAEFSGTRLAPNGIDVNGDGKQWVTAPLHWGYADNLPNNAYKGFSIDWAVDADGNPVSLEKVDFVKVHTGVIQNMGWIGENSTEVCGAEDLHPDAVYSPSWPEDPIDPASEYGMPEGSSGLSGISADEAPLLIYDLQGRLMLRDADAGALRALPAGIYIERRAGASRKIIIR